MEASAAIADCRSRRLAGQLPTYVASTQCVSPRIINAYQRAGYRYMDLVADIEARRQEIARQIDLNQITEAQAMARLNQFIDAMKVRERQRDAGR